MKIEHIDAEKLTGIINAEIEGVEAFWSSSTVNIGNIELKTGEVAQIHITVTRSEDDQIDTVNPCVD